MIPADLRRALKSVDRALARLAPRRRVLFDVRTPMNLAVLRPVLDSLGADPRIDCRVTSEDPDAAAWLGTAGVGARYVPRRRAAWQRVDLYINADPWGAASLHRCGRRLNFFHGVAGKYDLDAPDRLPIAFDRYDRIAFINADRLRRYVAAGVIRAGKAALVGYPKVDALARGEIDGAAVRARLGLAPRRPTALYAPTFSVASSLHLAGSEIVETLLRSGWNVIVKLHDRSLVPTEKYTAGIDWRAALEGMGAADAYHFARESDATPLLAAADMLVTDHSTIGFEYLLLDRPLVVFDAPDLPRAARINPEKLALLRSAARVVTTIRDLQEAAREALHVPSAQSDARRRVAAEVFFEPGTATARAVALACELLELPGSSTAGAVAPAAAA